MGLVITQDKRLCAAFFFVLFLINNSTQDLESSNLVAELAFIACGSITLLSSTYPVQKDSEQLSFLLFIPTRSSWVLLSLAVPALELPN
jgi:hypothetical protein